MSATVSVTSAQIFQAVGNCLVSMLGAGFDVIQGQENRVPQPKGPDYLVMTEIDRMPLARPIRSYLDNGAGQTSYRQAFQPTQVQIQADVYGPNSAENAQVVSTLWRDLFACEFFDQAGLAAQALSAADPRKAPITNAESQFEARWIVDLMLQCNILIGTPMTFSISINVTPIEVNAAYPIGD